MDVAVMSIDPRYLSPTYRGPETDGLTPDEQFDLAKLYRRALQNKRVSKRLRAEREHRQRIIAFWGVALSIATLVAGITLAAFVVMSDGR
jgi:hypothetical protein